jgi:hypothetical protein
MNRLKIIIVIFAVIFMIAAQHNMGFAQKSSSQKHLNPKIERSVKKAFDALRNEDFQYVNKLESLGEKLIPYLEPYLFDENDLVWHEVLNLLVIFYTKEGSVLLAKMLADQESFYGTSNKIHEFLKASVIAESPEIRAALLKSFSENRYSLTGILLLKSFPGAETEKVLEKVKLDYGDKTEVLPIQFLTLRISLVANLVLCNINNSTGCGDLTQQIETITTNEAFFLMLMLDDIKNPEILQKLQNSLLADTRIYVSTQSEAIYKNPDGSSRFVRPQSRVCDIAVDFLIRRFKVKVSFEAGKKTYTQSEIDELNKKLNLALVSK